MDVSLRQYFLGVQLRLSVALNESNVNVLYPLLFIINFHSLLIQKFWTNL